MTFRSRSTSAARQPAVAAEREVAEPQRAERDPLEPHDVVADRLAHPPHLPLAALVQHDLEPVRGEPAHARRRGPAVLELHAVAQPPQRRLAHRRAAHLGAVDARHLERRVRQAVRELAVVRQQQQAGGVGVEPPDRVEALAARHERDDRRAALRVLRRADVAGRLVQRVDDVAALERGRPAVDRDGVALPHVARRVAHDLAADRHAPGEHELLRGAPRGDARVGEELGEPHRELTLRGAAAASRATLPPYGAWTSQLLDATLAELGQPAFRARQVWRWTATGAPGYDAMTDLPAALRAQLAERVPFSSLDGRGRGARARRHGEGAVPHRRRPPGRGRADALPQTGAARSACPRSRAAR